MFRQCPHGPRHAPGPQPPATRVTGAGPPRSAAIGIAWAAASGRAVRAAATISVLIIVMIDFLPVQSPVCLRKPSEQPKTLAGDALNIAHATERFWKSRQCNAIQTNNRAGSIDDFYAPSLAGRCPAIRRAICRHVACQAAGRLRRGPVTVTSAGTGQGAMAPQGRTYRVEHLLPPRIRNCGSARFPGGRAAFQSKRTARWSQHADVLRNHWRHRSDAGSANRADGGPDGDFASNHRPSRRRVSRLRNASAA